MLARMTVHERQRALLRWYRAHGRHALPWRHGITPYRVLVSEVMLQQTQVDRAIPYFERWAHRWPTLESLARARQASVVRAWAGLGYNRRAVHLHRAAQEIVRDEELREVFAMREGDARVKNADIAHLAQLLQRLPGIGSYTAHALLAFAWNLPAPCVDVNVRRVLAYAIYRRPAIMRMPLPQVERLAARVIPKGQGRRWNSALMDYGALEFTARDVPERSRPQEHQGTFVNSTRFWRGRIVAVLRAAQRGKTSAELRIALRAFGNPPRALAPLLNGLASDGIIARRGSHYALA